MHAIKSAADAATLNNGVNMPWLGLGVYKAEQGLEVERAIAAALESGYRLIDTAALYGNEESVGRAVGASGIPRGDIFVTTKVWNDDQGYDRTLRAFDESARKLGMDTVDLYLVHWPVKGKFRDTYRALEQLYKDGRVRAIGVSNFHPAHLDELLADCEIVPAVNQVELHPLLAQKELLAYCKEKGILVQAWRPLMQGNLDIALLSELAAKYGKTPAQIVLRWNLQCGVATIPKSVQEARIRENASLFDFELSEEDMSRIDGLDRGHRFGANPDNFNF